MKRMYLAEKVKDANTIGLVLGYVSMECRKEAISRVRKLCKQRGKKLYVFYIGKVFPFKIFLKNISVKAQRFYVAFMLRQIWEQRPLWEVAQHFDVPRGWLQSNLQSALAQASSIIRFAERTPSLWALRSLLPEMVKVCEDFFNILWGISYTTGCGV